MDDAGPTSSTEPRFFWLPVALTAVAIHSVVLALFLKAHHFDPSVLVCINPACVGFHPFEYARTAQPPDGYDGQFYYAIARDPWRLHHTPEIDQPARQARILYPLLAWLLSGGEPVLLFWVMPLVNLIAAGGLAGTAAVLARAGGLSRWWGLLLPAAVCADLSILRDLTDLTSSLAVALMLVARFRGWPAWALGLAALAALFSREPNVAVVVAILTATVWRRRLREATALVAALLAWGAWMLHLEIAYGGWPFLPAQTNLEEPLTGLGFAWSHLGQWRRERLVNAICLLLLAIQAALTFYYATRTKPDAAILLVAAAGLLVVISGGQSIYTHWWAFMRVQAWLPLALWLGFAGKGKRWPLVVLALASSVAWYHVWDVLKHGPPILR